MASILAMPPNLRCLVLRQLAASRPLTVAVPISSVRFFSSTTANEARLRLRAGSNPRTPPPPTNKPQTNNKAKEQQAEKPRARQQSEKPRERQSEKHKAAQPEKPTTEKQHRKPREKQLERTKRREAERTKKSNQQSQRAPQENPNQLFDHKLFESQLFEGSKKPPSKTKQQQATPKPKDGPPAEKKEKEPRPKKKKPSGPVEPAPSSFSFLPPPSNDPNQLAVPAPPPTANSLFAATHIFTCQKPHFMYAAPRFLNFPVNTHVPEVCILGRSNVGKSTLINALSGAAGAAAGRAHGLEARRAGRAITSSHAGSTKTMNAYGFGPPPKVPPPKKEAEPEEGESRILSRSEKREEKNKFSKERKPTNSLILVDMPGYGFNSQAEWGKEIVKYLEKRKMLKGAVVLIDSVAGVKKDDRAVLGMLRDAGVRTTVILTKADKIESLEEYHQAAAGGKEREKGSIGDMCVKVWQELRAIEEESLTWVEGKGWERELFVTGAGDPRNAGLGIAGARLAIAKMAGLVRDERALADEEAPELGSVVTKPAAPTASRIVPFDQIVWATPHQGTANSKGGREKASF